MRLLLFEFGHQIGGFARWRCQDRLRIARDPDTIVVLGSPTRRAPWSGTRRPCAQPTSDRGRAGGSPEVELGRRKPPPAGRCRTCGRLQAPSAQGTWVWTSPRVTLRLVRVLLRTVAPWFSAAVLTGLVAGSGPAHLLDPFADLGVRGVARLSVPNLGFQIGDRFE